MADTGFSVEVDDVKHSADFALIDGKIELHHAVSSNSRVLSDSGASAVGSNESIVVESGDQEGQERAAPPMTRESVSLRISTKGRCRSVVQMEKFQDRRISDEFLYLKSGDNPKPDHKSFFEFNVSKTELERLVGARLRLNLVPSPLGVASLLPKVNRFAV